MCCISVVGKILEAQEDDQQVGRLQRLEPGDVRAAGLDEAGLRIGREEDAALEPVVLRQNPRQRRQRLLGAVLVVAGQKARCACRRRGPCRPGRRRGSDSAPSAAERTESRPLPRLESLPSSLEIRPDADGLRATDDAAQYATDDTDATASTSRARSYRCRVVRVVRGLMTVFRGPSDSDSEGEPNRPLHDARAAGGRRLAEARVDLLARRVELGVGVDAPTSSPG